MCGIVAYLGYESFVSHVLDGLQLLLNRGYDSVGISTIDQNNIVTIKHASNNTCNALEYVNQRVLSANFASTVGIGHTRWATHGAKTTINAHPHTDNANRIALVHNGIIENYAKIRAKLIECGYHFVSQTDTEVVAVLIGSYLDKGYSMTEALQNSVGELSGTWALIVIHRDYPKKIWITRNGSPLLLGMDDRFIMVASESIAFSNRVDKYVVLENHDIIEIEVDSNTTIKYSENIHTYAVKLRPMVEIENKSEKYAHWMLKEIMEQSESAVRAMNNKGRVSKDGIRLGGLDMPNIRAQLEDAEHLILLGCGTSYHAGLWSQSMFKRMGAFHTVSVYDGAEFTANDVPVGKTEGAFGKCAAIFLSQSGETKDLHRCIEITKSRNVVNIGVVNVVDSMIARETDCGVYLNAGREVAVASTKSFTNQCIVLAMISQWFAQIKYGADGRVLQDMNNLPFHLQNVLDNLRRIESMMDGWHEYTSIFLLGKGQEEAIAYEGALKIKEVAYIHAEGYSSSALKHGPFALICDGLPIVLLDIGEENRDKCYNAYAEVYSRGADIMLITDNDAITHGNGKIKSSESHPLDLCKKIVVIDRNRTFGGIIANVYLQYMSYLLAVRKGNNPDYPRNLAKVVTVE